VLAYKIRFAAICFTITVGAYSFLNRDIAAIQFIFPVIFFMVNTYVLAYSFFAVVNEGERNLLEYVTLSLIILLNILAIYSGYNLWVVAYTAVFWFAFGVVPFSVTLLIGLVRKYKRKRR
jgi:hypothetical protein